MQWVCVKRICMQCHTAPATRGLTFGRATTELQKELPFPLHDRGVRLRIADGPIFSVRETYLGADDRAGKHALRQILVVKPV